MGRLAAELLIAQIEAPTPPATERHFLEAPLVARASTGPPPCGVPGPVERPPLAAVLPTS
jgi:hypothetical protein